MKRSSLGLYRARDATLHSTGLTEERARKRVYNYTQNKYERQTEKGEGEREKRRG